MSTTARLVRRFVPDSRVATLIERYGATRVAKLLAIDADSLRRYAEGVSQRATRWWIECHLEPVARELGDEDARRAKLVLVGPPSSPPGEGA
jgi:hypothetical protein